MSAFLKFSTWFLILAAAVGGVLLAILYSPDRYPGGLPIIFLVFACYAGLVYLWFWLYRRFPVASPVDKKLWLSGYGIAGIVALYFLASASTQSWLGIQSYMFQGQSEINNYQESPINWPGFEGAVGIIIEFDLEPASMPEGYLRYPKLVMGEKGKVIPEDPVAAYWEACNKPAQDQGGCMTTPLWPIKRLEELDARNATHVKLELFPANLYHLESPDRVCIMKRNPYSQASFVGLDTVALWHFAAGNRNLDLSRQLTEVIHRESVLLKEIDNVQKLYRNMESGAFLAAGYQGCEIKKAIRFGEETECFCREEAVPFKVPEKAV